MIALFEASRQVAGHGTPREILAPTTTIFDYNGRVGILAARGTGKSVIARLLSGIEEPDSGRIVRTGRVSWPMGFAGAFHPDLTPAKNIELVARLLGEDAVELTAFCDCVANLGPALHRPMRIAPPAVRAALAFSLSVGVSCDTYIADDSVGFGYGAERELSEALLDARLTSAGLVFLSSNAQQISRFCDRYFVLVAGRLVPCTDLRAGQKALDDHVLQSHPTSGQLSYV